jgi:prophage DNA circulation protein
MTTSPDAAARALLALLDDMILVIAEENALMAAGIPGSTSPVVARKRDLADALSRWIAALRSGEIVLGRADRTLRARLVEKNEVLRRQMDANVGSLRASMAATRRRIDAIMRAIREQSAPAPSRYGANGRIAAPQDTRAVRPGRYL